MGRTLAIAVVLSVLLVAHETQAWRSYPRRGGEADDAKIHAPVNKTNSIGLFSLPDGNTRFTHFALYDVDANPDGCYGFIGTMDVYGFTLSPGQGSETSFSLANPGDEAPRQSNIKGLTIGWNILPEVYGDSHTHLFTMWTNDGFESTGCLNMKCPGFQSEKGAAIAPGAVIEHVSDPKGARQTLNLKIIKDGALGDWNVYVGLNRDPELIGRFPRSLFTGQFMDRATALRFGGATTKPAPMGSGYLPEDGRSAASISNIHSIDREGRTSLVNEDQPNMVTDVTDQSSYNLSTIVNGRFLYGGPWHVKS